MFCKKCGKQLPDGTKFCTSCGTKFSNATVGTTADNNVAMPPEMSAKTQNVPSAQQEKKSSKGLIIAIVSVLLVGVIILGILFIPDLLNKDKDDADSDKKTSSQSAEVSDSNNTPDKPDKPAVAPDTTIPKPSNDFGTASVGDYIKFGSYEQDNNTSNGKEEIEWLVLDKQDGKVLVISKHGLDCKPYNVDYTDVIWETCTLRSWLNNEFINEAFSSAEQGEILTTTVSADKNPTYDTAPGNATQDKVFLLSINEAERYFSSDDARQCEPTDYAVANNAYTHKYNGNCWWWLRSPSIDQYYAASVDSGGDVRGDSGNVYGGYRAVRPAMWITL